MDMQTEELHIKVKCCYCVKACNYRHVVLDELGQIWKSLYQSWTGWKSPPLGVLKVIIDAGCFVDGQTCWSLIVRNHEGVVITVKTKIENASMTPILAKVVGLQWCLNWIEEHKLQNIVVEMDVESVSLESLSLLL